MTASLHLLSLVGQLIDSLVRFLPVLEQAEILLHNSASRGQPTQSKLLECNEEEVFRNL